MRYEAQLEELRELIDLGGRGVGVVVAPTSEADAVTKAIAGALGREVVALDAALITGGPELAVARLPNVPRSGAERSSRASEGELLEALLRELNDRRDWIRAHDRLLVVLMEARDEVAFARHAPDVRSALLFRLELTFEPDESASIEDARAAMRTWLEDHVGKLDLRGFIRSEQEDVSWSVEDIYQELRGQIVIGARPGEVSRAHSSAAPEPREMGSEGGADESSERRAALGSAASPAEYGGLAGLATEISRPRPISELMEHALATHDGAVIVGPPGSGKSFFLRHAALRAAREDAVFGRCGMLPILVPAVSLDAPEHPRGLVPMLEAVLCDLCPPAAHVLRRAVDSERALVLIDGIDELPTAAARERLNTSIREALAGNSGLLTIATSRPGEIEVAVPGLARINLLELDDETIRKFVSRWCFLYAANLWGTSEVAHGRGEEAARELTTDIFAKPEVLALARTPLLLTIIALAQRAGVRLPAQRVELYEHAATLLVERWSRIRSLAPSSATIEVRGALRMADAIRVLGPLALDLVRSGQRTGLTEERLIELLGRSLQGGRVTGFGTAREAIELFRESLGLLVEQAPGRYSFLHLTFLEYFAARELCRGRELERVVEDSSVVFAAEWREVVRLALAVVGAILVDDERLAELTASILGAAKAARAAPSSAVPALLSGMLADEVPFDDLSLMAVLAELIPAWWLDADYPTPDAYSACLELHRFASRRMSLRVADAFAGALSAAHGSRISPSTERSLDRVGAVLWSVFLNTLDAAGIGSEEGTKQFLVKSPSRRFRLLTAFGSDKGLSVAVPVSLVRAANEGVPFDLVLAQQPFDLVFRRSIAGLDTSSSHAWVDVRGDFSPERFLFAGIIYADPDRPFTNPWWGGEDPT